MLAPVGRWQKNKDIHWYGKEGGAGGDDAEARAQAKKEELRRVKEAEEDALSVALSVLFYHALAALQLIARQQRFHPCEP